MSDLMNYVVTQQAATSVTVPRFTVSCKVVDSANQATVLADLTGANAIAFPAVIATLSAANIQEFIDLTAMWLVHKKAGV